MDNDEFVSNVRQWAEARNLISGSSPDRQFFKLMEELGEWAEALKMNDRDQRLTRIKDGLGDSDTVLVIMLLQCDGDLGKPRLPDSRESFMTLLGSLAKCCANGDRPGVAAIARKLRDAVVGLAYVEDQSMDECRAHAWNEIKDRRGRMVNGLFVKDAPPLPAPENSDPFHCRDTFPAPAGGSADQ